jgi:hypothetical protein
MSIGSSPIAALAGSVQQNSAQVAYNRQVSDTSSGANMKRPVPMPSSLLSEGQSGSDTSSISRPGMVALESTQSTSTESTIRDKDSAGQALSYSESQIAQYPDQATLAQANQTPQQILALEME